MYMYWYIYIPASKRGVATRRPGETIDPDRRHNVHRFSRALATVHCTSGERGPCFFRTTEQQRESKKHGSENQGERNVFYRIFLQYIFYKDATNGDPVRQFRSELTRVLFRSDQID